MWLSPHERKAKRILLDIASRKLDPYLNELHERYGAECNCRYFCNPNFKDLIEVLPGTYATEAEKKYPSINSGDYLVQRLTATY